MNFIKEIENNNISEKVHRKFTRYSKGEFKKDPLTISQTSTTLTLKAGFEYEDILPEFFASLNNDEVKIKGVIISKNNIFDKLSEFNIEPVAVRGKKYTIDTVMDAGSFRNFIKEFSDCFLLLNLNAGKLSLKSKQSVPKPNKPDSTFFTMKVPASLAEEVIKEFLYDIPAKKFRKAIVEHTYFIDELIFDKDLLEKDPAKARLEAKRKGRINRVVKLDDEVVVDKIINLEV